MGRGAGAGQATSGDGVVGVVVAAGVGAVTGDGAIPGTWDAGTGTIADTGTGIGAAEGCGVRGAGTEAVGCVGASTGTGVGAVEGCGVKGAGTGAVGCAGAGTGTGVGAAEGCGVKVPGGVTDMAGGKIDGAWARSFATASPIRGKLAASSNCLSGFSCVSLRPCGRSDFSFANLFLARHTAVLVNYPIPDPNAGDLGAL